MSCKGNNAACISLTIIIVLLSGLIPVLLIFLNESEVYETSTERKNLLVAILLPLSLTIMGFLLTCLLCTCKNAESNGKKCKILTIWFLVIAMSIPVGLEFGMRFASVPDLCNTENYCSPDSDIRTVTKIFPSRVSGRGYKIGPVCVSVCPCVRVSVS